MGVRVSSATGRRQYPAVGTRPWPVLVVVAAAAASAAPGPALVADVAARPAAAAPAPAPAADADSIEMNCFEAGPARCTKEGIQIMGAVPSNSTHAFPANNLKTVIL